MSLLLKDAIAEQLQQRGSQVTPDELIVKATQKGLKAEPAFNYTRSQSLITPTAHEVLQLSRTINKEGATQAGLILYGLAVMLEEDLQQSAESGDQQESLNGAALQAVLDQLIQDHDFQAVAGDEIASLAYLLNPRK